MFGLSALKLPLTAPNSPNSNTTTSKDNSSKHFMAGEGKTEITEHAASAEVALQLLIINKKINNNISGNALLSRLVTWRALSGERLRSPSFFHKANCLWEATIR